MASRPTSRPRHSLAGGAAVALVAQITTVLASAIASVVLARLLGPAQLGTYVLVASLILVMTIVSGLGFQAGITFYVSSGLCSPGKALRAAVGAGIGLGLVGALLTLGIWRLLGATVLGGITWVMAVSASMVLPAVLSARFGTSVTLAQERYRRWGALQIVQAVLGMIGAIAGAISFGVTGAVVGFVGGQILASGIAVIFAANAAAAGRAPDGGTLRGVFQFGMRAWSADILQFLNYRLDFFLLNAFADAQAVGVYAIATGLTSLGWIAPQALGSVVFPRVARLSGADASIGDASARDVSVVVALRHAIAFVPVAALALSVLAIVGIPLLYGSEFTEAIPLAFILLPGVLALGVGKVVSAIIVGRGHPEYSLYNTLITVPITIGLYVALIPLIGTVGAAIASTISYALTTAIAFVLLKRVATVRLREIVPPIGAVVADYRSAIAVLRAAAARR